MSVGESKVSPVLGPGIYKKLGTLQRGPPGTGSLMTRPSPRRRGSARCTTSGEPDSGKDTKVQMLHAFLGHGKDNYGAASGKHVVQQTRYLTAKDGPAPYHARTSGKRLAWASEVPEHYSCG